MHFKLIDGVLYGSSYQRLPQWQAAERFAQKGYLKFSLGIALMLLLYVYMGIFAEMARTYTFVTEYLPNIIH